jgi:hypothetical protein
MAGQTASPIDDLDGARLDGPAQLSLGWDCEPHLLGRDVTGGDLVLMGGRKARQDFALLASSAP